MATARIQYFHEGWWGLMVDKVKQDWWKWMLQGLPAAFLIGGLILSSGQQLGKINERLDSIEKSEPANNERINSLGQEMHNLELKVQELEDELKFERKIIYPSSKHGVDFDQEPADASAPFIPHGVN